MKRRTPDLYCLGVGVGSVDKVKSHPYYHIKLIFCDACSELTAPSKLYIVALNILQISSFIV
jgi:hypothetical protein